MVVELRQVLDVLGEKGQLSEEAKRRIAAILSAGSTPLVVDAVGYVL